MDERVRELVLASAASSARQGLDIAACPYDPRGGSEPRQMARLWVGAYLRARPPVSVAYDDDADDDEEDDRAIGRARDGHELHEYWTQGAGLGRWVNDPHPFKTLLAFLVRHMPETKARKAAAEWFREVKGFLPSGHPPGQQDPEPAVDPVTLREQRERERRNQRKRRTVRRTVDTDDEVERANQLKEYWLRGEGAGRWATWTQLYNHLVEHVGSERAKRIAAEWYHERYGIWPGHKKGSNPTGPG